MRMWWECLQAVMAFEPPGKDFRHGTWGATPAQRTALAARLEANR